MFKGSHLGLVQSSPGEMFFGDTGLVSGFIHSPKSHPFCRPSFFILLQVKQQQCRRHRHFVVVLSLHGLLG